MDFEDPPDDFCQESFINMLTVDIQEYYPNAQFSMSGSVTKTKASFHLVATNYIIKDESQLEQCRQIAKAIWSKQISLDWKVYTVLKIGRCKLLDKANQISLFKKH